MGGNGMLLQDRQPGLESLWPGGRDPDEAPLQTGKRNTHLHHALDADGKGVCVLLPSSCL